MLDFKVALSPFAYVAKLCSVPTIPEKYDQTKVDTKGHKALNTLSGEFRQEILKPRKAASDKWEYYCNTVSLVEKVTIIAIFIFTCTESRWGTQLKKTVIVLEVSKLKLGVSVLSAVSSGKFILKSVSIYHKRSYTIAQSRSNYILRKTVEKLAEIVEEKT